MKPAARLYAIFNHIEKYGDTSLVELAKIFSVSEMTIRRNVESLQTDGAVQIRLGVVSRGAKTSYEPPFSIRVERNAKEKREIATTIAQEILDGESIIIDGGSTGVALAMALVNRKITVCTPSLRVANVLSSSPETQLIIPGGMLRKPEETFIGAFAAQTLANYRFDSYFMTVSGVDLVDGCTEWNLEDAAIKQVAMRVSGRTTVMADSTKFARTAFAHICDLKSILKIVTDGNLSSEIAKSYAAKQIKIQRV